MDTKDKALAQLRVILMAYPTITSNLSKKEQLKLQKVGLSGEHKDALLKSDANLSGVLKLPLCAGYTSRYDVI
jgi:hypothetical protein